MTSFFVVPSFAPVSLEQLPAEPDDVTIICRQEALITQEASAMAVLLLFFSSCCAGPLAVLVLLLCWHAACCQAALVAQEEGGGCVCVVLPWERQSAAAFKHSQAKLKLPLVVRLNCLPCPTLPHSVQLQDVREYNKDAEPLGVIAAQASASRNCPACTCSVLTGHGLGHCRCRCVGYAASFRAMYCVGCNLLVAHYSSAV